MGTEPRPRPHRSRSVVPAGRGWPVDDAPGLRLRGTARSAHRVGPVTVTFSEGSYPSASAGARSSRTGPGWPARGRGRPRGRDAVVPVVVVSRGPHRHPAGGRHVSWSRRPSVVRPWRPSRCRMRSRWTRRNRARPVRRAFLDAGDAEPEPTTTDQPPSCRAASAAEIPAIFREADLTPSSFSISLITAAALGAGHALTPGHGKTLMAAYLVGTRGSPRHALGLGISVSVSHTVGILVLAAVVVAASDALPPMSSCAGRPWWPRSRLAIGGWMLFGEIRRRRAARRRSRGRARSRPRPRALTQRTGTHITPGTTATDLPRPTTITWRSLFVLGLAGGLDPIDQRAARSCSARSRQAAQRSGSSWSSRSGSGWPRVMSGIGLPSWSPADWFDRDPSRRGSQVSVRPRRSSQRSSSSARGCS